MNSKWVKSLLCTVLGSIVIAGCAVDADDDPDVITGTPSSTTVIEDDNDAPDVNVTTPASPPVSRTEVEVDSTPPATTTTTTTGG